MADKQFKTVFYGYDKQYVTKVIAEKLRDMQEESSGSKAADSMLAVLKAELAGFKIRTTLFGKVEKYLFTDPELLRGRAQRAVQDLIQEAQEYVKDKEAEIAGVIMQTGAIDQQLQLVSRELAKFSAAIANHAVIDAAITVSSSCDSNQVVDTPEESSSVPSAADPVPTSQTADIALADIQGKGERRSRGNVILLADFQPPPDKHEKGKEGTSEKLVLSNLNEYLVTKEKTALQNYWHELHQAIDSFVSETATVITTKDIAKQCIEELNNKIALAISEPAAGRDGTEAEFRSEPDQSRLYSMMAYAEPYRVAEPQYGETQERGEHKAMEPAPIVPRFRADALDEVLIVEDDQGILKLLESIFKREGLSVHTVSDGLAAMHFIDTRPVVKIVLLDSLLPYKNGLQLLKHIKSKPDWEQTSVIIMADNMLEKDKISAIKSGAEMLEKPFNPRELAAKVHHLLKRWNA